MVVRRDYYVDPARVTFVAVGTLVDQRPPHRSVRAGLPHTCAWRIANFLSFLEFAMHRYNSVRDLTSDITNHLADLPVRAYQANAMERLIRLIKRHRTAVVLVASYLLMRLLLIAFARS
jgi:hypothetical protein